MHYEDERRQNQSAAQKKGSEPVLAQEVKSCGHAQTIPKEQSPVHVHWVARHSQTQGVPPSTRQPPVVALEIDSLHTVILTVDHVNFPLAVHCQRARETTACPVRGLVHPSTPAICLRA